MAETERSRAARLASEQALVRVVHHYGSRPEFVVLGGLVPELLCAGCGRRHAGTTDIDVQVDLEVACGAVNTARLEEALKNAEFEPHSERSWRWVADGAVASTVIRFELLADLDTEPAGATVHFDACDNLGAINLRGTGFASRDAVPHQLTSSVGGQLLTVEVNVAGLAGYLLAKSAAAYSRRLPKDWYDIAFVLLHNQAGGAIPAADAVRERFRPHLFGSVRTGLDDLLATSPNLRTRARLPTPGRWSSTTLSSTPRPWRRMRSWPSRPSTAASSRAPDGAALATILQPDWLQQGGTRRHSLDGPDRETPGQGHKRTLPDTPGAGS